MPTNRGRKAPEKPAEATEPADAIELPPLSAPIEIDRSKAKGKHLRILAGLAHIRTEAELIANLAEIYDLVNTVVVGGMDERPATDFWPAFVEMRKQLEGRQGN